jgi:hypothetical protein
LSVERWVDADEVQAFIRQGRRVIAEHDTARGRSENVTNNGGMRPTSGGRKSHGDPV